MPFADVTATIASRLQESGKNVDPERQLALLHLAGIAVVGHPVIVRIKSGQQRSSRWRAERGDGKSAGKIHPLRRQTVEAGRLAYRVAVGAQRVEALLVAAEQENMGTAALHRGEYTQRVVRTTAAGRSPFFLVVYLAVIANARFGKLRSFYIGSAPRWVWREKNGTPWQRRVIPCTAPLKCRHRRSGHPADGHLGGAVALQVYQGQWDSSVGNGAALDNVSFAV